MTDILKKHQTASQEVERLMIDFLIQYAPAYELKVSDVLQIAAHARRLSFDLFYAIEVER